MGNRAGRQRFAESAGVECTELRREAARRSTSVLQSMRRMHGGDSIRKSTGWCEVSRLEGLAGRPRAERDKIINAAKDNAGASSKF